MEEGGCCLFGKGLKLWRAWLARVEGLARVGGACLGLWRMLEVGRETDWDVGVCGVG